MTTPVEPYDSGLLDVGDGNQVYWETCGNPDGKPSVLIHGGPGQGCTPKMRSTDQRFRQVLFDQRGCGRSTPHASDPTADMSVNTTQHLINDMELLREHLGIDRWLLNGGSWGSTLGLAYAQAHPDRVTEIVLMSITSGRRVEAQWLYDGVRRFFPGEYEAFFAGGGSPDGDLVEAYSRLMEDPDASVREGAARAWMTWEDTVLSLEPNARPNAYSGGKNLHELVAFVRICAHYISHDAFLEDGVLIREAGRLAGIPGVLIHGRQDLSCPLDTAWEIARNWPGCELRALADSGHLGSPSRRATFAAAMDRFSS